MRSLAVLFCALIGAAALASAVVLAGVALAVLPARFRNR